jgi:hypothetical protein
MMVGKQERLGSQHKWTLREHKHVVEAANCNALAMSYTYTPNLITRMQLTERCPAIVNKRRIRHKI